ncbi:Aldedh domain-containing protein [Fusarium falciforme]|uniref:Aldedh domain-containing protein n=1 Tax=Fusarium falciforme TaxID=195108 RepID=UPI0022FFDEA2|nr:Aldedh domain-containing protein [Fusarium falciforme]WAO95402.1 Aldedh domain-containing protein [Fusarium falciforme]
MPSVLPKDTDGRPFVACIIDGQPLAKSHRPYIPIFSSQKQETVHFSQSVDASTAVLAVESSWKAFQTYRKTPIDDRRRLLTKAAELFDNGISDAMHRQMTETSCNEDWAKINAGSMSVICQELAAALENLLDPAHDERSIVVREPIGPVLSIIPWNGALLLAVRAVATALAAGCTVILKASEMCPWTHQFVAETFLEAGFPKGSVNLIVSSRGTAAEITETIISHPHLRKIEFIGSPVVGRSIGTMAAKYLKPTIMELGDQSPLIVLEDADLSKAAQACAQGATLLHGQVCFSTERVIVVSSVKDKFYSLLAEAFDALPSAGFAVSNTFADKAYVAVQDALSRGARVVAGSSQRHGPASMASSILAGVPRGSILSSQEGFAPTAFVVEVENDKEAIAEANSREGGMSAAIFTSNRGRAIALAKELEFGMVQINDMTLAIKPSIKGPATCTKGSGWGCAGGKYGIKEFTHYKAITFGD